MTFGLQVFVTLLAVHFSNGDPVPIVCTDYRPLHYRSDSLPEPPSEQNVVPDYPHVPTPHQVLIAPHYPLPLQLPYEPPAFPSLPYGATYDLSHAPVSPDLPAEPSSVPQHISPHLPPNYPDYLQQQPYPSYVPEYQQYLPRDSTYYTASVPPADNAQVFPRNFSFGVGSGPYHIEGAWDQDFAVESIWDRWIHTNPCVVIDSSNGDEAADAYNHIKEDVEILNNLAARHYRFGISWPRIFYDGCEQVNQKGIDHYKKLIHLLKLNQIEPIVTIYHGDLPQALQDQGGFLCPHFVEWYVEYAKVLFENFGDEVTYWITFDKPTEICKNGYGDGTYAPGINDLPGYNEYVCGHNLLKAHAAVYHLYDDIFRSCQKGKISIALASDWYEPLSHCEPDQYSAETKLQFELGWWAHPIYIGDYPPRMIERIRNKYDDELHKPRLPLFTHEEIACIKDTHDFFSLTYHKAFYVTVAPDDSNYSVGYEADVGVDLISCEGDFLSDGIRKLIGWVKNNYNDPSIFLTGDRYGSCSRDLNDDDRIQWIMKILKNVRAAMIEDDARVYAYTYYSYIDGFEWLNTYAHIEGTPPIFGYSMKYGLYDVDFDCPQKTRTPRKSAGYYQHLCMTGCIEDPCPMKQHTTPFQYNLN